MHAQAGEEGKMERVRAAGGMTEGRSVQLAALDLGGLGAFLAALKAARAWPAG